MAMSQIDETIEEIKRLDTLLEYSVMENKIILYTTDDGRSQVSLLSRDGRVWLNQKQMAELFTLAWLQ